MSRIAYAPLAESTLSASEPLKIDGQGQKPLDLQLSAILQGIERALEWTTDARRQSPRLDMEADRLVMQLRRCRIQANDLYEASRTPTTVGFYGHSTLGKLQLITALAVGPDNALEAEFGANRLDVRALIEPQSRATGLALRFSRRRQTDNATHPVLLTLLDEADIVMIMATLYQHNGMDERYGGPDDDAVDEALSRLQARRQPEPAPGLTADRVVEIQDYVARRDRLRQKQLETRFWPVAIALAPYLSLVDRAELFSLLWPQRPDLTQAYSHFTDILRHLGGARQILAPLGILVDDSAERPDGILDCASLGRLHTASDPNIQVIPLLNGAEMEPVQLTVAEVAMLAAELLIPLTQPANSPIDNTIDLMDFSGPDESLASEQSGAVMGQQPQPSLYPLATALLRARRTTIFTRYTERRAVDWLMVCTAVKQRSDILPVGKMLDYWVKRSQGENTRIRSRRKPGLIWALTRYDQRVVEGRNYDEAVQRYLGNPGDAWGTLLATDARAINGFVAYLSAETPSAITQQRLLEQTAELRRELTENLLGVWRQPTDQDPAHRQHIANTLLKALQARAGMHGELLEQLVPQREALKRLYRRSRNAPAQSGFTDGGDAVNEAESAPFGVGVSLDLLSESLPHARVHAHADEPLAYARNVQQLWINHLRGLPHNDALLSLLGIARPTMELLMAELIIASIRLDILSALENCLENAALPGLSSDSLADRQVARVLSVLGDFVAWLGFTGINAAQRPDSRIDPARKIFTRAAQDADHWGPGKRLNRLDAEPVNNTANYVYDWLVALNTLIKQNSGFTGEAGLTPAQRERLDSIIDRIKCNIG